MEYKEKYFEDTIFPEKIKLFPPIIQKALNEIVFPDFVLKQTVLKSFYIYGPIGSGKSVLASALTIHLSKIAFLNRNKFSFTFVNVSELLLQFRQCYQKNSAISEMEMLENLMKYDLLILDDFGVEKTTEWAFQMLYILINRRYEQMKAMIITSNLNLEQLADKLGDDRIPSRIQGSCEIVKWTSNGKDYRK